MSKASTSSIQNILRQLYHAKNSVSNAIEASTPSASGVINGSSSSSTVASYSTATSAARSLHHAHCQAGVSPVNDYQHHTPSASSTSGEWATSSSSSNTSHSNLKTRGIPTTHHYHRHNANHHNVASANVLPSTSSPFWSQQPSSSNSNGNGGIPPFTSNTSNAGYSVTPSTSSSSTSSSGSSLLPSSTSSSNPQFSDATHFNDNNTSSSTPSSSTTSINVLGNESTSESNNKISSPSAHTLTLHPGAYGIPKRLSSVIPSVKGKEKETHSDESIQSQIDQMRQSLLSVQVGEDAYFVRHDALGVADGVGGWSGRKGADPGLFAARLMHHCSAELALVEEQAARDADALASASSTQAQSGVATSHGPTPTNPAKTSKLAFVHSATATANKEKPSPTTSGSHRQDESAASSQQRGTTDDSTSSTPPIPTISPEHYKAKDTSLTAIKSGDPIEILHKAWDLTLSEFFDFELIGSSTALIALLKDDELRLANIGDCSCSIIRRRGTSITDEDKEGEVLNGGAVSTEDDGELDEYEGEYEYIFRSQEQQHSFNYPFQMGTNSKDTPRKDGQSFNIKIQKNDLIIISSDGLVDNLFDEDILEEIERQSHEPPHNQGQVIGNDDNGGLLGIISPERLSKALCSRAKAVSEDQRAVTSPFQQKANEEGIHFVGGKHDDITVLVAVIGDKNEV